MSERRGGVRGGVVQVRLLFGGPARCREAAEERRRRRECVVAARAHPCQGGLAVRPAAQTKRETMHTKTPQGSQRACPITAPAVPAPACRLP
jgi:hypothetical protein